MEGLSVEHNNMAGKKRGSKQERRSAIGSGTAVGWSTVMFHKVSLRYDKGRTMDEEGRRWVRDDGRCTAQPSGRLQHMQ